jgi:dTDP-glucose 4,6-dehydratase
MLNNILVTGAAGFIGSNFVHYWLDKYSNARIIVVDALTYAGNPDNLKDLENNPRFAFIKSDIGNTPLIEQILTENDVDTVVHFAAESHVDRSITGPDEFINTNILGTYSLLKACKSVWLDSPVSQREEHRFHHVSTDEVYGTLTPLDPPFKETNQYQPNSPYSASKASSDMLVRAYHHTYGLKVTTSNCSNNYGYYHHPEKLIPLTLTNILYGRNIPVYGDGRQIRDWLFVMDHCLGIDLILHQGRIGESYNIGGINEWANIDIVNLLCEKIDVIFSNNEEYRRKYPLCPASRGISSKSLITYVKDRPGHDRRYAIDASKIMHELNYKPQETFESGIQKTILWYLANDSWWKKILKIED